MTTGPDDPQEQEPPPYQGQPRPQQGFDQMMQRQYGVPGPSYGPPGYVHQVPPTDNLALAALITGIATLVLGFASCGLLWLAAPAPIVLGRKATKRIDQAEARLGGRGFAVTGFVLGIVSAVLFVAALAMWAFIFAAPWLASS